MSSRTYNYDEIFEDIEGDPDNVLLKIPPEICEEVGFNEGDLIQVTLEGKALLIMKKVNDNGTE